MSLVIERQIAPYIVRSDASLREALQRIDQNHKGMVFCVTESGILEGVLTDGDFRRWLLRQNAVQMNDPVSIVANTNQTSALLADEPEHIECCLNEKIKMIPLLDGNDRIVAVARRRKEDDATWFGEHPVGPNEPCFVVAEIGLNHNGCVDRAKRLVDAAAAAGADCVKFQMRNMEALYRTGATGKSSAEDLGVQYTLNLLRRFELPAETMFEIFDYAKRCGLTVLCTPWDPESLALLDGYGMEGFKIASADLTNHDLVGRAARLYKPLLVSTGMSTDAEIVETVALMRRLGTPYVLLHCNSAYPAPFKDVQLRYMSRLREIGQCEVGYSGHERGIHVSVAAVAMGAKVVEKHITEDRELEGSDHKMSLLPDEFKEMVVQIRQIEESLGADDIRHVSQGEVMNRANLAKSLVAACNIKKGDPITEPCVLVRSPGRGLQPNRKSELLGHPARRDIHAGDFFYPSDLDEQPAQARSYTFRRPWGLTVRWHDFRRILPLSNPGFLEFHLSCKDMEEDYLRYFNEPMDLDLKVHSPDTFEGDHLLDLSNEDPVHRERSIRELQRVIELTRKLKPYFRKAERPVIIASLGGFSRTAALTQSAVRERYGILQDSLDQLDTDGVELVAQTLPPFPWYFGGQLFLNLFVNAQDTADFCKKSGLRICLDVSHSKLACNHFRWSMKEFVDRVAPYVAHLHIADAKGVDGEGIQVGEGDLDFPALRDQLNSLCPQASFMPEIWQGHKNDGEGFWVALDRLEKMDW
ncbi:MAG: N-acetylneuraminate synthase family protein [Chloroflexi bacterium]|nr:N-acetylneuraminate synthase family protein [Chloroflexota bacterium]